MLLGGALAAMLAGAPPAAAHPERHTSFPNPAYGQVPVHRDAGPRLVVCAADSRARILAERASARRSANLRLLAHCGFRDLQAALDDAPEGARVEILPGVYRGAPRPVMSQQQELLTCGPPEVNTHGDARKSPPDKYVVYPFSYQASCPALRNAFWIIGNSSLQGRPVGRGRLVSDCTRHCFLQVEGTGVTPDEVVLQGDRQRPDVLHVDRADGTYLANFTVEHGSFNGINVIETNGYAISHVVARRNQNYGVLTFTTDHGLYDHVTAYQNGHAGVYPGSTAEGMDGTGRCSRYAVEMVGVDSYDNTYGYSGTAANSVWVHDSSFHDNATGISTDSLSSAHPAMPQDCAKWEHNTIYSNNFNPFARPDGDPATCASVPYDQRPDTLVCPYFAAPVGTGIQIGGGNANLAYDNWIYDNRRTGIRLFWIPPAVRVPDPRSDDAIGVGFPDLADTSFGNHFVDNRFGVAPNGSERPNGADFWWDGEGAGNCAAGYGGHRFSEVPVPDCRSVLATGADPRATTVAPYIYTRVPQNAGGWSPGNGTADASQISCIEYDPTRLQNPPGCSWLSSGPTAQAGVHPSAQALTFGVLAVVALSAVRRRHRAGAS